MREEVEDDEEKETKEEEAGKKKKKHKRCAILSMTLGTWKGEVNHESEGHGKEDRIKEETKNRGTNKETKENRIRVE